MPWEMALALKAIAGDVALDEHPPDAPYDLDASCSTRHVLQGRGGSRRRGGYRGGELSCGWKSTRACARPARAPAMRDRTRELGARVGSRPIEHVPFSRKDRPEGRKA